MLSSSVVQAHSAAGPEVIKRTETVVDARTKASPIRHFGIALETDEEENNGTLLTFKFVSPTTKFNNEVNLPFSVQQTQLTTALKLSYPYGTILQSKEKSAVYPVIQFYRGTNILESQENEGIIQGFSSKSYLYKEMRHLECDENSAYRHNVYRYYVILGFKTTDVKFNQALLDSWKDWTGSRYIYINFPDKLNLKKITLYHKQTPDDINLYAYLVMVECDGVDSKQKQIILLDFVQRLRAERTSNFISVYDEVIM